MGWYERAVELHNAGHSVSQISDEMGISPATVRSYIVSWWAEQTAEEDARRARLMYSHGLEVHEIAGSLHRDQTTIRKWVRAVL